MHVQVDLQSACSSCLRNVMAKNSVAQLPQRHAPHSVGVRREAEGGLVTDDNMGEARGGGQVMGDEGGEGGEGGQPGG